MSIVSLFWSESSVFFPWFWFSVCLLFVCLRAIISFAFIVASCGVPLRIERGNVLVISHASNYLRLSLSSLQISSGFGDDFFFLVYEVWVASEEATPDLDSTLQSHFILAFRCYICFFGCVKSQCELFVRSFLLSPVSHTDESHTWVSRLSTLPRSRLVDLDIVDTHLFDFDRPQLELWVALLHLLYISLLRRRTFFALRIVVDAH